jgi:hypothetical protein
MAKVAIDNLEVGMVLAADVHDRAGRMLLGAGVELTPKHLVIFRTWGVEEAEIVGDDDGTESSLLPAEVTPELLATAEAALAPLFRTANLEHPAMAELFRLASRRKAVHASA